MLHCDISPPAQVNPYPASGIPLPFRLYHGGSTVGGQLLPREPHSHTCLGGFIYFTPLKIYARRFADNHGTARRTLKSTLFVADARRLPKGTRVFATDSSSFADNHIDLCGLIDLRWELADWHGELIQQNPDDADVPVPFIRLETGKRLLGNISHANVLGGSAFQNNPKHTSDFTINALHQLQAHHNHPKSRVIESLAVLAVELTYKHPYYSAILFALQELGSLDISANQVRYLQQILAERWLQRFSVPFEIRMLPRMRAALEERRTTSRKAGDGDSISDTSDGLILVVPGPVAVASENVEVG